MTLKEYIAAIGRKYMQGNATEHSYRGSLEALLQEILPQMAVTNEPKRVRCGAPDYIYAILHSPSYRKRYEEFLKIDFPRIPYPTDLGEFRRLSDIGTQLRRLHLMEGLPIRTGTTFPIVGTNVVDRCQWEGGRVYINATQYFDGVTEQAFQHYIGGYQPALKWLKDRKGRTLDFDDVRHYERIIYVLDATRHLMDDIDNPAL